MNRAVANDDRQGDANSDKNEWQSKMQRRRVVAEDVTQTETCHGKRDQGQSGGPSRAFEDKQHRKAQLRTSRPRRVKSSGFGLAAKRSRSRRLTNSSTAKWRWGAAQASRLDVPAGWPSNAALSTPSL